MNEQFREIEERKSRFVSVDEVAFDYSCSKAKAYQIIRNLNDELKRQYPHSQIVAGRVNRVWYEESCLERNYHGMDHGMYY